MGFEISNGPFLLSTDQQLLDLDAVYGFLSGTYWAQHRPRSVFEVAVRNSLCFGIYREFLQVGFARAITDRATFAYLADVYVLEPYRRRGLGTWLVQSILAHPELMQLRRWCLLTQDMHELYRKCGFDTPANPDHYMEKLQPYPVPDTSKAAGARGEDFR